VRPCCEPDGGGWAGCTACGRNAVENLKAQIFWRREECAQRRGKYLRCKVAAIKPKA